ncbi:MAG: bifunctional alpha,alpha-trehalose-phosphate synthase (UDP-forming)/trehalose-phosphatase [Spirochaetaceae bacterium]|nr:MAG: bifunctional alpha,alpha-trehalose-phosphate synthase (UDP-forming)/trehalose-phosphatase [Spirochaetaceae bacterium]
MANLILISNRLSVSVEKKKGGFEFKASMGGLATGLSSLEHSDRLLWIGWPGLPADDLSEADSRKIASTLKKHHNSIPVELSREDLRTFYYGFCNNVIWPLFHYFPSYATYDNSFWESYRGVNSIFLQKVLEAVKADDTIWIHDYQLMLLPRLIREKVPEARIGYFLHIPFPSFEIFRLLPWRNEILTGLLGADLIGFHAYDYARHFVSSVRRLLGVENNMGYVQHEHRLSRVDVFPMGIDYQKYSAALSKPDVRRQMAEAARELRGFKVILSVDRLDYTKGIPERLRAFELLLEHNPKYREKVVLLLIAVPSRTKVHRYRALKKEVDELISTINGKYGTIGWVPIHYFYRGFPFDRLSAFYGVADVLLVTPLRDGMNLVAKEFVAAKKLSGGVLILSETAGSAREMGEALLINPNNSEEIAAALCTALEMERSEQIERNTVMNERLSRYDIGTWTKDFLNKLSQVREVQDSYLVKKLSGAFKDELMKAYRKAVRRLIILDYDGTLVSFQDRPRKAAPDEELVDLLKALSEDPGNDVVVASGRMRDVMNEWFGNLPLSLIACHGAWLKHKEREWQLSEELSNQWKEQLRPIFQLFKDRTPGSTVEEKEYALAWHYRNAEPELAAIRASEFKDILFSFTGDLNLDVLEGKSVLEIKPVNVSKARAVSTWLSRDNWQFIMAAGDDNNDEVMFSQLPASAYSIKIGLDISEARYYLDSPKQLRQLLNEVIV